MLTIENLYILVAALVLVCVALVAFLINANLQKTKQRENLENLQDELKDSERLNIEQRAKLEASSDKINELAKNLDEYKISLKQKDEKEDELERELRRLNEELGSQTKMAEMAKSLSLNLQNELGAKEDELKRSSESENELKRAIVALKSEIEAKENILRSQEENLKKVKNELNLEFANLANKIFEEKSANFSKNSKESLELLLTPLGEKITSFEKRVNDAHSDSQKSAGELSAQLKEVVELG